MSQNNCIPWLDIRKMRNSILIVDANAGHKNLKEIEHDDRESLLKVNQYVEYRINQYNLERSSVVVHRIIDRIIDEFNNLILITESKVSEV